MRWYEIKAPDIACTDRVRVVVFGSHIYDEQTYAVDGGQIRLARPEDSLSHGNLWLTGGVGILNERLPGPPDRFAAAALLGGHFEWYAWLGALEAGVIAQGTETDVIGTDAARKPTVLDAVPYLRFDLQAGYELWPWRSLHFGGSAGLGLGFPVSNDDHVKVAVLRPSLVAELNSRIRLAHHVGRWSEIAAGVRLGEAHRVFPALDLTAPARIVRPVQLYVALRLWFLIG